MTKVAKYLLIAGAGLILLVQLVSQLALARLDSQTTDEGVHISAGYTYLTKGDFRFNPEHPPLVKLLAALPLLFIKPAESPEMTTSWNRSENYFYDSWRENRDFGEDLLYQAGNNPDQILFWARLPNVIITFLLGLTIFLLVRKFWGELAGVIATIVYAFDPTINAHGHLVTTDIPLALTFILALYCAWLFLNKPSWKQAAILGLTAGIALLTKHTAIIFFPTFVVMAAVVRSGQPIKDGWRDMAIKLLSSFVIIWLVIWAGFGFHDRLAPQTNSVTTTSINAEISADTISGRLHSTTTPPSAATDKIYSAIHPLLLGLPGDYLKGLFLLIHHVDSGQSAYLLGQTSTTGWWYYFPVLFIFKTPVPTLILLVISIYLLIKARPVERLPVAFASAGIVFLLAAMSSKANLGIRHIMPIYPVIFILISWSFYRANLKTKYLIVGLLVWLISTFIFSFPTYLGYFNTFSGGSSAGYKIATDSNVDWGQDLHRITNYVNDNHIADIYIEYGWDGPLSLDYYLGKNGYKLLSEWLPGERGTAIIGASAYNNPQYQFLHSGHNCQQITSGTFTCQLQ